MSEVFIWLFVINFLVPKKNIKGKHTEKELESSKIKKDENSSEVKAKETDNLSENVSDSSLSKNDENSKNQTSTFNSDQVKKGNYSSMNNFVMVFFVVFNLKIYNLINLKYQD